MPSLKKQLEAAEEHIPLPSSSEEEDSESDISENEHEIDDPFLSEEESDFDSDEAPEALSFKSASDTLKLQKKQTLDVIKLNAEEKRKKRKELHEQYLLSKEEKKRKIEAKMLPEDVLQNLSDEPVLKSLHSDDNDEENNDDDDEEEEKNDVAGVSTEELVEEHDTTMFKCKILTEEAKKSTVPEKILNFKDQLLYGGRIRREKNSKVAVLKKEKQKVRK